MRRHKTLQGNTYATHTHTISHQSSGLAMYTYYDVITLGYLTNVLNNQCAQAHQVRNVHCN